MAVSTTPSTRPPTAGAPPAAVSPGPALGRGFLSGLRVRLDRRTVTLTVEAGAVRLVVLQGRRVVRWATVPLPPGAVRDGAIEDAEAVAAAVRALLAAEGLANSRRVLLGIPGGRAILRTLALPDVKGAVLRDAVPRLARSELPVAPENVYLFWQAFPAREGQRTLFLLGVLRSVLDSHLGALRGLGIGPRLVDLRPIALARAVNRAKVVIADVSPTSFDIVVVVGGLPVLLRSPGLPQQAASSEERAAHILEELKRTVQFYEGGHPAPRGTAAGVSLRDASLVLVGELASDPFLKDFLQARFSLPLEPARIPVDCPPDFPVAEYAANVGLALKEMPRRAPASLLNLNLLPAEMRPRPFPLKQVGLGLAFAAAVALLIAGVQFRAALGEDVARLSRVKEPLARELEVRRQGLAQLKAIEERVRQANAETESLAKSYQSLVARRGAFSALLETAVEAAPPQVRPAMAREEAGKEMSLSGAADSYDSVLEYVRALESTRRFKRVLVDSMVRKNSQGEVSFTLRLVAP